MNKFVLIAFIMLLVSNIGIDAKQIVKKITAPQLLSAVMKQKHEGSGDLIVINVLNHNAYADCHIKDSIHLPIHALAKRAKHRYKSGKWSKDKMIVVYCANLQCPLSRHAYKALTDIGFTNVWAYEGGMHDWMLHNKKYGGYKYPTIGNACGGYLHE